MSSQHRERGGATVFVMMLVGVALAGAALSFDLGSAAVQRSAAADAATAIAKAGATELFVSDATSVDSTRALAVMGELAEEQWPDLQWDAVITAQQVVVTVNGSYEAKLLDAFGWSGAEFEVSSRAGAEQ